MSLAFSAELSLPIDAVTQRFAFLGRVGSGKSYGASKLGELMDAAGAQIVVLDPVGTWFGLRVAGTGEPLTIPVFGGLHGDVPLVPTSGALIADLIVDRGISAVLDVSQFEVDADKAKFARDFAARFFFRKKAAPSAVHLFIEECQEFVPQNPARGEEHMLHAFARMAKLGRNFGIGLSLISQRPQEINKKVLNLTECLLAFQMTGTHERKAIEEWAGQRGIEAERMRDTLPFLKVGAPHVWSPQWLEISRVVKIAPKRTANVSQTPKVGARAVVQTLSTVDLKELQVSMAETVEKAEQDDPKKLRARIAELERASRTAPSAPSVPAKHFYKVVQDDELVSTLRALVEDDAFHPIHEALKKVEYGIAEARLAINAAKSLGGVAFRRSLNPPALTEGPRHQGSVEGPPPQAQRSTNGARVYTQPSHDENKSGIGGGERKILIALAQHREGLTRAAVAMMAGYAKSGGTFGTYLSRLRTNGYIEDRGGELVITEAGEKALGSYEPLPVGEDLRRYWESELGSYAQKLLGELADVHPRALHRDALAARTGYEPKGGTYGTYLSRLRTLGLIEGKRGVRLAAALVS